QGSTSPARANDMTANQTNHVRNIAQVNTALIAQELAQQGEDEQGGDEAAADLPEQGCPRRRAHGLFDSPDPEEASDVYLLGAEGGTPAKSPVLLIHQGFCQISSVFRS